jgi:adenylate cyclase
VALDPESSFAHYALSGAFIWANEHTHAITEARTAVQLNPSDTAAWLALANRLDIAGAAAEGIPLLEATLRRNPRDPHNHTYYAQLGRAYINARDYAKALEVLREAVRLRPDFPNTYHVLAICLGHLGRIEEARAAARRCEELRPGFLAKRTHWNIYLDAAANEHLTEGLSKAGLVP